MIENDGKLHVKRHPFPHAVIDGWWADDTLEQILGEFPDRAFTGWKSFANSTERKLEGSNPGMWGPVTRDLILGSMAAKARTLAAAFDTPPLTMETIGGGYHLIEPGGYLAMHADFSRSPATGRYRWLNMLVYLNHDWREEGGCLQLWDDDGPAVTVAPEFNRTVVFRTSGKSWHGHPVPNTRERRSVAAYFYADEPPPGYLGNHSTRWHPLAEVPGAR